MGALAPKRFEENRGNCKLCHLNPFEFFDHTEWKKESPEMMEGNSPLLRHFEIFVRHNRQATSDFHAQRGPFVNASTQSFGAWTTN